MTTLEILEAHQITKNPEQLYRSFRIACECGETFKGVDAYDATVSHRAHVAEVLDKHIQAGARRAQVNALNGVASAWEEMASPGAHHLYARMLRETANRIGAEPNGR